MIEIMEYGPITQIKMSREMNGRALYWVAAYLVDGLLVDTGCSYTSTELAEFLSEKNVRQVVNTHFHEDHIGGNRKIITDFNPDMYAHRDSIPLIASRPQLYPYQEQVWGYPEPSDVKPVPDVIKTDNFAFKVIETPGHCAGHISLIELSKGWCFCGDIFTREKIKFIRPEENIGELMASMKKIYDIVSGELTLFTSVGKIIDDGHGALKSCIDYLDGLRIKVRQYRSDGYDADEIMKLIFGEESDFSKLTNGQFSSMNLTRSLLEM